MIPVDSFNQVKIAWIYLNKIGCRLYGFILYTSSDRNLVDYMSDGIYELDQLTGEECTIFVLEPPSSNWIEYAKIRNHTWLAIYSKKISEAQQSTNPETNNDIEKALNVARQTMISNISESVIVVGSNTTVSVNTLLAQNNNGLYGRVEAINIARNFGIKARELPCMIFFESLDSSHISFKSLKEFESQPALKSFFRYFFDSDEFKTLINGR